MAIIFSHIHYFIPENDFWQNNAGYFMLLGLGIFVFISGLLIDLSYSSKTRRFSDILSFYKKRAVRILPLNWLSIILQLALTLIFVPLLFPSFSGYNSRAGEVNLLLIFIQFIGLQLLFRDSASFLWFVSFIMICYLLYPIFTRFAKNIVQLLIISLVPLLIFGFIRLEFGMIDDRLFWYYMIFIGGIAANRLKDVWNSWSNKKLALFLIIFAFSSFVYLWRGNSLIFEVALAKFMIREMLVMNIASISGCFLLLLLLSSDRIHSFVKKFRKAITWVATSSYCVYLFHFPFFTIGTGIISLFQLSSIINDVLFYILVIPITFGVSYYIQIKEKVFRHKLRVFFFGNHRSSGN